MRIIQFCWLFATVLVIASCTGMGASESNFPTLRGQVMAGPACPAQLDMSGCEERPVAGAFLLVLDSEGQEVTQLRSDERGQFSANLQPGRYYLVPMPVQGLMGTPDRLEIVVDKIGANPINIKYDTGIRTVTPPLK